MFRKSNPNCNCLNIILCWLLITTPILTALSEARAYQQDKCEKELQEAELKYRAGRFDEAIALLAKCLRTRSVSEGEKLKAYRLLGLVYIAKDIESEAKKAIRKLLDLVPGYKGDPVIDPPQYLDLVEEVRNESSLPPEEKTPRVDKPPERNGGSKKWLVIGGAGLLVVVGLFIIIPPKTTPLPGPPDLPERQ